MAPKSREPTPTTNDATADSPSRDEAVTESSSNDKGEKEQSEENPLLTDEPVPDHQPKSPTESPKTQNPESSDITPPLPDEEVPPLPDEPVPATREGDVPPLPHEPVPEDDGWDYRWDYATNQYVFFNCFTGAQQFENPRLANAQSGASPSATPATLAEKPEPSEILGYNPAIHGDYDPNAWYAKLHEAPVVEAPVVPDIDTVYDVHQAAFNRFTGHFQEPGETADRYTADAKANRQLNSYFDVEAAANAHHGRSLKAERQGKKLSKNELKQFKEKRKAKKEEKRRAWLRD